MGGRAGGSKVREMELGTVIVCPVTDARGTERRQMLLFLGDESVLNRLCSSLLVGINQQVRVERKPN